MAFGVSGRWMLCRYVDATQVHIVAYCVDLGYGPTAGAEMLSLMLMGAVISRLI